MAIPDNYLFTARDVCTELQFSTSPSSSNPTLTEFLIDAPNSSFDSTYEGSQICLRNFRGFELMREITKTADINESTGVGFDSAGNAWYTTRNYNSVVKVNLTTYAQTCYPTTYRPRGIDGDASGNVWTANVNDGSVSKYTSSGVETNYVCAALSGPWDIVFDGTDMWTANYSNDTVAKITPTGVVTTYTVGDTPFNITFDGTYIWTGNQGDHSVSRVSLGGTVTTYTCPTLLKTPRGIAYNGTDIFVGNQTDASIVRVTTAGVMTCFTAGIESTFTVNIAGGCGYVWARNSSDEVIRVSGDGTVRKYNGGYSNYEAAFNPSTGLIFIGGSLACMLKMGGV